MPVFAFYGCCSRSQLSKITAGKCITLHFWRSEVRHSSRGANTEASSGLVPFGCPRGAPSPAYSSFERRPHSLPPGASLHFHRQQRLAESAPRYLSASPSPAPPPHLRTPGTTLSPLGHSSMPSLSGSQPASNLHATCLIAAAHVIECTLGITAFTFLGHHEGRNSTVPIAQIRTLRPADTEQLACGLINYKSWSSNPCLRDHKACASLFPGV